LVEIWALKKMVGRPEPGCEEVRRGAEITQRAQGRENRFNAKRFSRALTKDPNPAL
jgi:hypothetical protein